MKRNFPMQKCLPIAVVLLVVCIPLAVWGPANITNSGTAWTTLSISAADLISGPGSNLQSAYESSTSQSLITIDVTGATVNYRVDVKKADTLWPAGVDLSIKRTGDGTGGGTISGGGAYQVVTNIDAAFFSGSQDRNIVPCQLKISNISIQVPPNPSYSTTLSFTVVAL